MGILFIFPLQAEYLALYRDILKIIHLPTRPGLIMHLLIPKRSRPIVDYDVFCVHAVPIKSPNSTYFLNYVDLPRYLAVNSDRQYYHTLEICPSEKPLYAIDNNACIN